MFQPVRTSDPTAVEVEVQSAFLSMFPDGDRLFVPRVFGWVLECFTGSYKDYQAIDALYHDFEHTLQGTLCLVRLLHARAEARAQPAIDARAFQLALLAILLHDTGYLKKKSDTEGTGAKYTVTHVHRSAVFAAELLQDKGFRDAEIRSVQNMIRCTGVDTIPSSLPFQSDVERIAGYALATADLLGQMAASDYVDKLPVLFSEFAEASQYTHDSAHFISKFSSAEDLVRRTPEFWRNWVLPKLDGDFLGLYRFLNSPFPDGPNFYLGQVEANIARLSRKPND